MRSMSGNQTFCVPGSHSTLYSSARAFLDLGVVKGGFGPSRLLRDEGKMAGVKNKLLPSTWQLSFKLRSADALRYDAGCRARQSSDKGVYKRCKRIAVHGAV